MFKFGGNSLVVVTSADFLKKEKWNFASKNALWQYDKILCNYFYYRKKEMYNIRTTYNIRDDVLIIADSGGLQLAADLQDEVVKPLDPVDIVRWQGESGINVGFVLDVPTKLEKRDLGWKDFRTRAMLTRDYSLRGLDVRDKEYPNLELYGILHGLPGEEMEEWWDIMGEVRDRIDGWCYGGTPLDSAGVLFRLYATIFLAERGVKKLHHLGLGSIRYMSIFDYIAPLFERLTFDATSSLFGGKMRRYMIPGVMSITVNGVDKNVPISNQAVVLGDEYFLEEGKDAPLPCSCPVCQGSTIRELVNAEDWSARYTSHDAFLYCAAEDFLMKIRRKSRKEYREVVLAIFSNDSMVKGSLDFIDLAMEKGLEAAFKEFADLFLKNNLKFGRSNVGFGFIDETYNSGLDTLVEALGEDKNK